jgi:hypothetical protein
MYGRGEKCIQNVGRNSRREEIMKDLGVDGEDNIRMDLRVIGWKDVYWKNLVQVRDWWRAVVNTVMNLRVP